MTTPSDENRWAAFTNDELAPLNDALEDYAADTERFGWNEDVLPLAAEASAELERRRSEAL